MKTYTFADAQKFFEQIIDEVQYAPITIIQNDGNNLFMLSNQYLQDIADYFLEDFFLTQVKEGKMDIFKAFTKQIEVSSTNLKKEMK